MSDRTAAATSCLQCTEPARQALAGLIPICSKKCAQDFWTLESAELCSMWHELSEIMLAGRSPSAHMHNMEDLEKQNFEVVLRKLSAERVSPVDYDGVVISKNFLKHPEPLFSKRTVDFFLFYVSLPVLDMDAVATIMAAGVLRNLMERHFLPKSFKKAIKPLERSMRRSVQDMLDTDAKTVRKYVKRAAFYIANRQAMDLMLKVTITNTTTDVFAAGNLLVNMLKWFTRYLETPFIEIRNTAEEELADVAQILDDVLEANAERMQFKPDELRQWNAALTDLLTALANNVDWSQDLYVPQLLAGVFPKLVQYVYRSGMTGAPLNSHIGQMQFVASKMERVDGDHIYHELYQTLESVSNPKSFF